jgi:hypothetical protein
MDSMHDLRLEWISTPIPSYFTVRYDSAVFPQWLRFNVGNLYDFNWMKSGVRSVVRGWHVT